MRFKIIVLSLLLLNFTIGIQHTVILGSLSLISEYFDVENEIGWFSVIFTITTIIVSPIIGYYSNDRKLKPMFRMGLFITIVGFYMCFIAKDFLFLLAGRGVAGIGTGILSVLVSTYLGKKFDLKMRTKIDGYNFLLYSTGTFIGPVIGSIAVLYFDWRGIFLISVILYVILYILLEIGLENEFERIKKKTKNSRLIIQSIMFSLFLFTIIIGIEFIEIFYYFLGLSTLFFFCYIKIAKNSEEKLFEPSFVKDRFFAILTTYSFIFGMIKFILTNYLSIYITKVLEHSLFVANFSLTIFLCGNTLGNYLISKLITKVQYKKLFIFSYVLEHICFLFLIFYPGNSSFVLYIMIGMFGFSNGFVGYPSLLILQQKKPDFMGSATASNSMSRHFGGIFGVILFQQFVIQTNGINFNSFTIGFTIVWIIFAVFGLIISFLPMEILKKNRSN